MATQLKANHAVSCVYDKTRSAHDVNASFLNSVPIQTLVHVCEEGENQLDPLSSFRPLSILDDEVVLHFDNFFIIFFLILILGWADCQAKA